MNGEYWTFIGSAIVIIFARIMMMLDLMDNADLIIHMVTLWFTFLYGLLKYKDSEYVVHLGFIWINVPLMMMVVCIVCSLLLVFT